jgi:hypothetical protein
MDLKKILFGIAANEAPGKLLPMESDKPTVGWKAKAATILGLIAAIATAASHFLGG